MKPCAERQMRGLHSHRQPDTGAPGEHGAAAWLSFHPDLLGTGTWPGAPGPPAAPPACAGTRGGERKMLAARHASTALPGGPWASWCAPSLPTWAGCTQTLQQAADAWICSHLLCPGMWVPLCSFSGTAWHFDTIYGVGVCTTAERVGESPCPALGRAEQPRGAPTLPILRWGGAGEGQRAASLLPASLFPAPAPSLTACSVAGRDPAAEEQTREGGEGAQRAAAQQRPPGEQGRSLLLLGWGTVLCQPGPAHGPIPPATPRSQS